MADENVIQFPKAKKPHPKDEMPSATEIIQNIQGLKEGEIADITEVLGSMLLETIAASGFKLNTTNETMPSIAFFVESLKSLICLHYSISHPFQEIAKHCFVFDENGDMIFREPAFRFSETEIPPIDDAAIQEMVKTDDTPGP